MVGGVVATQALQIAALAIPPLRDLLSLEGLSVWQGFGLAALGIAVLVVMEVYKRLIRIKAGRPGDPEDRGRVAVYPSTGDPPGTATNERI